MARNEGKRGVSLRESVSYTYLWGEIGLCTLYEFDLLFGQVIKLVD
jgi:hypothetical protein